MFYHRCNYLYNIFHFGPSPFLYGPVSRRSGRPRAVLGIFTAGTLMTNDLCQSPKASNQESNQVGTKWLSNQTVEHKVDWRVENQQDVANLQELSLISPWSVESADQPDSSVGPIWANWIAAWGGAHSRLCCLASETRKSWLTFWKVPENIRRGFIQLIIQTQRTVLLRKSGLNLPREMTNEEGGCNTTNCYEKSAFLTHFLVSCYFNGFMQLVTLNGPVWRSFSSPFG